ncbi:MAG TPA: hypothetical protein VGE38_08760 [Nocardioides sp.]|uniref:hypothetical protein n=1 Tax=Nocardioides sp. TaxID=35761 RepID=UPI002ED95C84
MTGPIPLHLGGLHPYEQALTLLLAFGPFLALGVLVAVRRRQDQAADRAADRAADQVDGSDQPRPGDDGPLSG